MIDSRTLDRRIRNLKRTRQVTYAMQLIASIKLKRVQKEAEYGRRYLAELELTSALLQQKQNVPSGRRLLILIATDRGFAGNANQMLADFLRSRMQKQHKDDLTETVAIGKHAKQILKDEGVTPKMSLSASDTPDAAEIEAIANLLLQRLKNDPGLAINVLSLRYVSLARQVPEITAIYPPHIGQKDESSQLAISTQDYLFEPSRKDSSKLLLPRLVNASLLALLREAKASEHAIRMQAMRQATDSADEMLSSLSLKRSRLRQQRITQEILEIVADSAARQ